MRLAGSDVTCIRGGREVFAALNFTVGAGEALAVTGRNGAGKSSLLRLIAGLLLPAGGSIQLHGAETAGPLAEQCHFLGHRDGLKPSLTVTENLEFWRDFLGGERGLSTEESLDASDIANLADLPASYLSAGQRRRLALARLVATRRPIWLLDEPTSTLDSHAQELLAGLMTKHLHSGGLIVAATHDTLGIATRELRIGGGR
ncbi:heme ABC exporter ATP-binding protein CcmA [Bradyrhizobium sp. LHD-71]|uniref:heme ABC exporter ATP-binding protein CcmA n=1 Tax=Bradyrhizobium sp. LHD-71 TaxID=3072141 RepID=UPI00280F735C|nr:heme ABC exporter ATP-binding protein CcmA [Bradyrhizobium sp. LHD-71]MDQ8729562.1 heme ABC exporter ATP-binding protein CcmA [Bradyrhizobium sp. LHD-71]